MVEIVGQHVWAARVGGVVTNEAREAALLLFAAVKPKLKADVAAEWRRILEGT